MSETTFTTSSGHRCNYEVLVDENGQASANVVWIGQPPAPDDIREFERFMTDQADQAQFQHAGAIGAINYMLGEIRKEDLPRVREIVKERARTLPEDPHE
jgi:hypothetical protein